MAANTAPIFTRVPKLGFADLLTANTAKDGTGTVVECFVAHATEGSYLQRAVIKTKGANVATLVRFFLNNGGSNTVAANNNLIDEVQIAASVLSETVAQTRYEVQFNMPLPAGHRLLATLGTTVAGGITITGIGGDY